MEIAFEAEFIFQIVLLKKTSPIIRHIETVCKDSRSVFVIFQNNRLKKRSKKSERFIPYPISNTISVLAQWAVLDCFSNICP